MTETPDKPVPQPDRPRPARKLRPASMLRLSLGRPRLPVAASRTLGWLLFILLAVVPLCATAAAIMYLSSARWPADFSAKLSHSTGLCVTVGRVTGLMHNRLELRDITIAPRPGLPVLLSARTGTYDSGEVPTLSLSQVKLEMDLDWWADPKAIPEPSVFLPGSSGAKPPVLNLRAVTIHLNAAGRQYTLQADAGMASLSNGLVRLKLASTVQRELSETAEAQPAAYANPLASKELLNASLGYQQGRLVKRLLVRNAPVELIRERLGKVLGREWASAFLDLAGDLVYEQPVDGANWELDGRGIFDPSLLEESVGLSGLGGQFAVVLKQLSGAEDNLLQGTFEISLIRSPYKPPTCSAQALKGLQVMATATEPVMPSGVDRLPFDRAGAVIKVTSRRVRIEASGEDDVAMSGSSVPILRFAPQVVTRQELTRRLQLLKQLWTQMRVS